MNNDLINSLFEISAGLLNTMNIFRIFKDKTTKGISWIPLSIFTMWGAWNLYYYPSLNQTLSLLLYVP